MKVCRLTPLRETSPASNFAPRGAFDRGSPAPGDRLWHRVVRLPPGLGQLAFPSLRSITFPGENEQVGRGVLSDPSPHCFMHPTLRQAGPR